jgi:chaperonin cofactor prefoldin
MSFLDLEKSNETLHEKLSDTQQKLSLVTTERASSEVDVSETKFVLETMEAKAMSLEEKVTMYEGFTNQFIFQGRQLISQNTGFLYRP